MDALERDYSEGQSPRGDRAGGKRRAAPSGNKRRQLSQKGAGLCNTAAQHITPRPPLQSILLLKNAFDIQMFKSTFCFVFISFFVLFVVFLCFFFFFFFFFFF